MFEKYLDVPVQRVALSIAGRSKIFGVKIAQ
jgi:hypothetical protein